MDQRSESPPLHRGHYQPNIPADLRFYDLLWPEVREAQAALARAVALELYNRAVYSFECASLGYRGGLLRATRCRSSAAIALRLLPACCGLGPGHFERIRWLWGRAGTQGDASHSLEQA